jgi:hypothetical protein
VENMPGNLLHYFASAVVLQRVLSSCQTTMEHTSVGGPFAALEAPVCDPPVEKCVQDSRMHSRWHNLGQIMQASMDLPAIHARWSTNPERDVAPSLQLKPNALTNIRGSLFLDGSDNLPLETGVDVYEILMSHVMEMFMSDATINVICMDATLLQRTYIPNKIETIIPIIPISVWRKPINVVSLLNAFMEFMHTDKNVVNSHSMQVARLYMFPAKVAAKARYPEFGCTGQDGQGLSRLASPIPRWTRVEPTCKPHKTL